jgi:light-regulated signal transduction histidine kinase (bacteriophytochrome)
LRQTNEKLAAANERLEARDKMQTEFINIAAHALSPIEQLLGLSDVLRFKTKDAEQLGLFDVMIRNAKRLQRLAEDILDATTIF